MCKDICCHCKPLKLEVGKTYVDGNGRKTRIVAIREAKPSYANYIGLTKGTTTVPTAASDVEYPTFFKEDGTSFEQPSLVKEYKEPVVHRRDIVWFKFYDTGEIRTITFPVGGGFNPMSGLTELHRQTIEYIEQGS